MTTSESEFLSLPESMRPTELVDGELVMAPSPSFWHQEVLTRLVMALRTWAASHPRPVTVSELLPGFSLEVAELLG